MNKEETFPLNLVMIKSEDCPNTPCTSARGLDGRKNGKIQLDGGLGVIRAVIYIDTSDLFSLP
jgi:hypothetical protein